MPFLTSSFWSVLDFAWLFFLLRSLTLTLVSKSSCNSVHEIGSNLAKASHRPTANDFFTLLVIASSALQLFVPSNAFRRHNLLLSSHSTFISGRLLTRKCFPLYSSHFEFSFLLFSSLLLAFLHRNFRSSSDRMKFAMSASDCVIQFLIRISFAPLNFHSLTFQFLSTLFLSSYSLICSFFIRSEREKMRKSSIFNVPSTKIAPSHRTSTRRRARKSWKNENEWKIVAEVKKKENSLSTIDFWFDFWHRTLTQWNLLFQLFCEFTVDRNWLQASKLNHLLIARRSYESTARKAKKKLFRRCAERSKRMREDARYENDKCDDAKVWQRTNSIFMETYRINHVSRTCHLSMDWQWFVMHREMNETNEFTSKWKWENAKKWHALVFALVLALAWLMDNLIKAKDDA